MKPDSKLITSPMADIPGDPGDLRGDSGSIFDGEPGLPAGTGGKLPELTYVTNDAWAKIPRAKE
jgi:hypothetical protein